MAIKVKTAELDKALMKKQLNTDEKVAEAFGVSNTQVWRVLRVPANDKRHCEPGVGFIDGVLRYFGVKSFEKFFYLE